jgi:hypothetical protein
MHFIRVLADAKMRTPLFSVIESCGLLQMCVDQEIAIHAIDFFKVQFRHLDRRGFPDCVIQGQLVASGSPFQFLPPQLAHCMEIWTVMAHAHDPRRVQAVVARIAFVAVSLHVGIDALRVILPDLLACFAFVINTIAHGVFADHHIVDFLEVPMDEAVQVTVDLQHPAKRQSQVISGEILMRQDHMFHREFFIFQGAVFPFTGRQTHIPNTRCQARVIGEADVIPSLRDHGRRFEMIVISNNKGEYSLSDRFMG